MYHHFESKEDVFAAVFVQTSSNAILAAAQRTTPNTSQREALISGCIAWLDEVSDPAIGRLLFTEGPTALGWHRCRTLEEATSLGIVRSSLKRAVDAGEIAVESIDVTARLLNAMLAEAALIQHTAGTDRSEVRSSIRMLLKGLRSTS